MRPIRPKKAETLVSGLNGCTSQIAAVVWWHALKLREVIRSDPTALKGGHAFYISGPDTLSKTSNQRKPMSLLAVVLYDAYEIITSF